MTKIIDDTNSAAEELRNGKVGIFPTDTAFGIGCRMDDIAAVERVYALRNRPHEKALIVLVNSLEMAKEYVEFDTHSLQLANTYWPGGVTIIMKCRTDKVPSVVRADGNTLAIRLPDHKDLREIIKRVGVPIVAPSANRSGESTPFIFDQIDPQLQEEVDFVLRGMCTMEGVSTIVDATVVPFKIVRNGVKEVENE